MRFTGSLIKTWLVAAVICSTTHTAQAQMRPPTVNSVTPNGAQRGATAIFTIEGRNLQNARRIIFDEPAITGRITANVDEGMEKFMRAPGSTAAPIEDVATRSRLTVEVKIWMKVNVGGYNFRIETPLGTTNLGRIEVGYVPETTEAEPNDNPQSASKISLPGTINGAIQAGGDADYYRFEAGAGQQLVFEISAARLQSSLDSTLALMDDKGRLLAVNEDYKKSADSLIEYRFRKAGTYTLRVTDALNGGGARHFYRLTMGELPVITSVFPLGLAKATAAEIELEGVNLGSAQRLKVTAPERPGWEESFVVPVTTGKGEMPGSVRLALGSYAEVVEQEPNDETAGAQSLSLPVTVNGRIGRDGAGRDEDVFAFKAKKGEPVVFAVMAQRLGSPLDSVIEVLDAGGKEVPRATLRPVWQTFIALADRDSLSQGLRLDSWSAIKAGDYVMVGNELIQVSDLPASPDADVLFKGFRGRRIGFEGTTPEGHALNTPVYKVEVHRPGVALPPNGMPLVHLSYRNDDGGPAYGKDSYLHFVAPEDGQYYVRIKDILGKSGRLYSYRLTVAAPRPDFTLAVSPANPNVPRGGRVPVTVTAHRLDGFDGPIEARVTNLPGGLKATSGTIPAGHHTVTLTLEADERAQLAEPVALRVTGSARIGDREVVRAADPGAPLSLISVAAPPDVYVVSVYPQQVEVEAGGEARITVKIKRSNGFEGRVPLSVQNLPFMLKVPDIGLNGIMVTEKEDGREFSIIADPRAEPGEQTLYVTARVEVNSATPSEHTSAPIKLRVIRRDK